MKFQLKFRATNFGLCNGCSNFVYTQHTNGREVALCTAARERPVAGPVENCNQFRDSKAADLWAMKETAWILTGDSKGKHCFVRPTDKGYLKAVNKGRMNIPQGLESD